MVGVAIAGSAVVGAGASMMGASKAAKAAKGASKANNALEAQIYGENKAALSPYNQQGVQANSAIGALLGIGGDQVDWEQYVRSQPDLMKDWQTYASGTGKYASIADYGKQHFAQYGGAEKRDLSPYQLQSPQTAAFDRFRDSTGYQFRLNEGNKNITAALGARGGLESGGAKKALMQYGQNIASDEFGRYYAALTGQQGVGLTAASAQAGVSQNYAGAVSANNNNAANATGNAALSTAASINNTLASGLSAYSMSQGMKSSYGSVAPPLYPGGGIGGGQ